MLPLMLYGVAIVMLMMALHVFRGGSLAFDAETNLEGGTARIVAVILLIASIAVFIFTLFIMPQITGR